MKPYTGCSKHAPKSSLAGMGAKRTKIDSKDVNEAILL